jgi:DNA polymerase-1
MNAQTIPRDSDVVKRAFIPKLDCFVLADYSNLEFRMLGYYMAKLGDRSVATAFERGDDLHQLTAEALGIERQDAKTFNYSMMYGGSFPTVMRQFSCSKADALALLGDWHAQWPGIAKMKAMIDRTLDTRGYLKTLWGRHLHPRKRHSALNALVQGCSADLMREGVRQITRELQDWDSHLVLTVHDSVILDVTEKEKQDVIMALPWLLDNDVIAAEIPLEIDIEVAYGSWADKVAIER